MERGMLNSTAVLATRKLGVHEVKIERPHRTWHGGVPEKYAYMLDTEMGLSYLVQPGGYRRFTTYDTTGGWNSKKYNDWPYNPQWRHSGRPTPEMALVKVDMTATGYMILMERKLIELGGRGKTDVLYFYKNIYSACYHGDDLLYTASIVKAPAQTDDGDVPS